MVNSTLERIHLGKKSSHSSEVDTGLSGQEIQDSDVMKLALKRVGYTSAGHTPPDQYISCLDRAGQEP